MREKKTEKRRDEEKKTENRRERKKGTTDEKDSVTVVRCKRSSAR